MRSARTQVGAARASRVATALATAAAFLCAGVIVVVHDATTTHVRCAEHGELTHGAAEAAGLAIAEASDADAVRGLPATTAAYDHDHCALACAVRSPSLHPPAAVVAAARTESDLPVLAPAAPLDHGDGLYRTAPKTSPPA